MRRFLDRLLHLLRLRRVDRDLAREIDSHLGLLQESYEARGFTPEAARRSARLALGSIDQITDAHRAARSFPWIEDAQRDVVHGLRLLRRSPLFALTAAASLAIGIGVDTAIFTIANGLLFTPPSGIAAPDRLVTIGSLRGDGGLNPMAYATYREVARRNSALDGIFAESLFPHVMSLAAAGSDGVEPVVGQAVTSNFFATLGASPSHGRVFSDPDDRVVVLDYDYWRRRFNDDGAIVGRTVRLNGQAMTVVGVAAQEFQGTGLRVPDIWFTMAPDRGNVGPVMAGGRLRPGVPPAAATAEVAAVGEAINRERAGKSDVPRLSALPFSRASGNRNLVAGAALFLMALVSFVLVIACANVAGIVLSRSTARTREMALRATLGAGRSRLVRQLLTETIVLYGLAAVLALGLAQALARVSALWVASVTPVTMPVTLDWRVLGFALLLSLSAALVSGVLPALKGARTSPGLVLAEGGRASSARSGLRKAAVGVQVAISVLLVVLSLSFARVLRTAGAANPGFDSRSVAVAAIDASVSAGQEGTPGFWDRIIRRIRHAPGIESASLVRVPPGGIEGIGLGGIAAGDRPAMETISPAWNIVDANYFATLRIPLIAGRDFAPQDAFGAPPVVIVSQAIARRLWPGERALGKPLALVDLVNAGCHGTERRTATIVGIAGDIKTSSLVDGVAESYVYLPLSQTDQTCMTGTMSIVARHRDGTKINAELALAIHDVDQGLVLSSSSSLEDAVALGLVPQRVLAAVAGAAGVVGLLLVSMGIYGVVAYTVTLRRREFAVRMALGAPGGRVVRMVVAQGLWPVVVGLGIGLFLAAGASQVLAGFLYGLAPESVPTLLGTTVLFLAVGLVACAVPAVRAVRDGWRSALQDD